jgi:hypothetical protein
MAWETPALDLPHAHQPARTNGHAGHAANGHSYRAGEVYSAPLGNGAGIDDGHYDDARTAPQDWSPVASESAAPAAPAAPHDDYAPYDDDDLEREIPARWIVAAMKRSDNPQRDQKRLTRLHGTLRAHPGKDRFIILVEVDGKDYRLDFPNETTNSWSDKLWDELYELGDWMTAEIFDKL